MGRGRGQIQQDAGALPAAIRTSSLLSAWMSSSSVWNSIAPALAASSSLSCIHCVPAAGSSFAPLPSSTVISISFSKTTLIS